MLKKYKTSLLGIECKKSQAKEFFMELKKKYIHMSHEKGRAMSQVTLDDDYNVPESKPDIVRIITTKGAIHLEDCLLYTSRCV